MSRWERAVRTPGERWRRHLAAVLDAPAGLLSDGPARLAARARSRHIGAGAKHRFGFANRLLATLVHLRHGLTHDVVAAWFGAHRSTITRSVAEVRPLLAERGCQVNDGVRLRTIADVVAYLGHHPKALMDATEVRVRRPVEGGRV
ncbi:transposase family protein, partial [Micromonospora sp. KC723]|uniref:helix-turn-helix domain-containing protein n=1 Tax=Micromonospora sp. KC723 TaxID=2530381 RepID=UPI001FB7E203